MPCFFFKLPSLICLNISWRSVHFCRMMLTKISACEAAAFLNISVFHTARGPVFFRWEIRRRCGRHWVNGGVCLCWGRLSGFQFVFVLDILLHDSLLSNSEMYMSSLKFVVHTYACNGDLTKNMLRQSLCHFFVIYTVSQKKGATLTMAVTLSILDRFAKFFHCCKDQ